MSTNPNVEKAAGVIRTHGGHENMYWKDAAIELDSAGLLLTPLHERALKACEEYSAQYRQDLAECYAFNPDTNAAKSVHAIGRESLAARKPVKSWTANGSELWRNGHFHTRFCTHAEAKAVQAALNALEAK